ASRMDYRYARRHGRARRTSRSQAAHWQLREGRRPRGLRGKKRTAGRQQEYCRGSTLALAPFLAWREVGIRQSCSKRLSTKRECATDEVEGSVRNRETRPETGAKSRIGNVPRGGPNVADARGHEHCCHRQSC